jgi:hypothetical protein
MRRLGLMGLFSVALATAGWLWWPVSPRPAVLAVANLSDPAKLATLSERGANPRLIKIVYWLDAARNRGLPPELAVDLAQVKNGTRDPRASLVRQSLLRNLKIADGLALFTPENKERMRNGRAPVVMRGPYAGSKIEVDHIVPLSLAKEAGNELANLEMMPQPLNRRKSNRVGERQLSHAQRLFDAGLLSRESLNRVQAHMPARRPGGDAE